MATIIEDSAFEAAPSASIWPTAALYGVVAAVLSFVVLLVGYNVGWMDLSAGFVGSLIIFALVTTVSIGTIVLGMRAYRAANGGLLSWTEGFKWALGYAVIGTLLSTVLTYFFYTVLAPDYFAEVAEGIGGMMEQFGASEEDIDAAVMAAEANNATTATVSGLWQGLLWSSVIGAIVAAVLKNR